MDLHLSSGCAAAVGSRINQEDYAHGLKSFPNGVFALLADGMGGHEQGEVASRAAGDFFDAAMAQGATLQQAAEMANGGLAKLKSTGELAPGAGCTLAAVQVDYGSRFSYVSVGDSYVLYFPAGGGCEQLNSLHTRGVELDAMAARGEISREQAARADKRQALVSAVTGKPYKYIDVGTLPDTLNVGDRILLLSDGFLPLGHQRLARMLAATPLTVHPQAIAQSVVDAVVAVGVPTQDNVTVVCLQVNDRALPAAEAAPVPVALPAPAKNSGAMPYICCTAGVLLLGLIAAFLFEDRVNASIHKPGCAAPAAASGGAPAGLRASETMLQAPPGGQGAADAGGAGSGAEPCGAPAAPPSVSAPDPGGEEASACLH